MEVKRFDPLSANDEKNVEDILVRCRIQMLINFPFFGILALHLKLTQDYSITTAATDGTSLFYNPHFIKNLPEAHVNWIVIHEVLHPALKHLWRKGDRNHTKWNYACDYALHNIMVDVLDNSGYDLKKKISMPPGCLYDVKFKNMSAEEIYDLLPDDFDQNSKFGNGSGNNTGGSNGENQNNNTPLDDHSKWEQEQTQANGQQKAADWEGKLISAAKAAEAKSEGNLPGFLQRILNKLTKPQKNWKTLLHEFVQPEVDDYSFSPPDRRFDNYDFFLPDFNDVSESVKDIIFMIDTSGSVGDKELAYAYSEITGAINQFQGKLTGKLGFFDYACYGLTSFEDVDDVLKIKPKGGGGTNFSVPFEHITEEMENKGFDVAGIVMLTDGYAQWPNENITKGIPVLWLITNESQTPPWGLHTTIKV